MQVRKLKSCFLHWNEIFLQHMTNVRIKYGLQLWHVKRLQFLMEILSPAFALSWRICKLKKINHYLEETISFCSFLLQSSPLHLLAYNNMSEYVPSFCVRRLFVKTGKNGRNTTTRSNTASSVNFHGQIVCCYHNPLAVHHFVSAEDKESAARTCLSNVLMLYILMIFFSPFLPLGVYEIGISQISEEWTSLAMIHEMADSPFCERLPSFCLDFRSAITTVCKKSI